MARERGVLVRKVGAEVRSPALGAGERALGDQPGQEMATLAQALEAGAVADEAGVLPESPAKLRRDRLSTLHGLLLSR